MALRGARRALAMGVIGGARQTYESFAQSFVSAGTLPIWLRFRETAGTTITNSGSGGATYNGTLAGTPGFAATGQLGAGEALTYNGTDTEITIPANAAVVNTWTSITVAMLVKMASAGESNFGRLFGNFKGILNYLQFNGSANALDLAVDTNGTDGRATTSAGVGTDWIWLFYTYSHTGDKTPRLYKGINGAVTEKPYSVQTPATGALSSATVVLSVGNNGSQSQTLNGLYDEFMVFTKVLSAAEMLNLVTLSGLT